MHDHLLSTLSFLISIAIAIWIGLHVARRIHRAGIEHYSGRILILAAITNTTIVALILLLLGAATLRGALTPAGFHAADLVLAVLLLVLPVRSVWNYIKAPARMMRRLDPTPAEIEDRRVEVAAAASVMGVAEPSILSSPQCHTPFVFGRNSRRTHLVLPDTWDTVDPNSRSIMLCHELAHVRNRDVGFLTWSRAFLNDLKWALLLSPIVIALSFLAVQGHLPRAVGLYVACLLVLWIMTNTVVRSRELLADATVAMLIDSGKIARTFDEILLAPETGLQFNGTRISLLISRVISRVKDVLTDKAMFSSRAVFWKPLAHFVELTLATHPSFSVRREAMCSGRSAGADIPTTSIHAFWAGLTLGLLAVLIALAGFWGGRYILGWDDGRQILWLSEEWRRSFTPLAITCVALFFVLPTWSSLRPHIPTRRNLIHLLAQYLHGFFGACCVLPLIGLGARPQAEIALLSVYSLLWVLFILSMGLVISTAMLSIWLYARYRRRYCFLDLLWILYSYGIGFLAIACYGLAGFVLLVSGRVFVGASMLCGLLAGLATFSVISKESHISGLDQELILDRSYMPIVLEGRSYRYWSPLVCSLHVIGICLVPAAVVSTTIYKLGTCSMAHSEDAVAMSIVLVLLPGCFILLFLNRRWPKRVHETCRQKICALAESWDLLEDTLSTASASIIDGVLENLRVQYDKRRGFGVATTQKMFELTMLSSFSERSGHWIAERTRQWALNCETSGGFGVWPGSGPRLSSTYQCLRILQQTGGIPKLDGSRHVSWIRSLQSSGASFRGPWSHRPRWEDTHYAVAALNMLGSSLENGARDGCLEWVRRTLVHEGIEKSQLDAFHHCLAAVGALSTVREISVA